MDMNDPSTNNSGVVTVVAKTIIAIVSWHMYVNDGFYYLRINVVNIITVVNPTLPITF